MPTDYLDSRPPHAEAKVADDAVRLAQGVEIKYYVIHTSCWAAAEAIEAAQTDKSQIRAETCVHCTTLDRTDYEEQGLLPMIAPPLRTPDDVVLSSEQDYDTVGLDRIPLEPDADDTDE
ncbi:hypothetical protein [Salinigranum marinum]|uniref:hypothetical protein n=1 Tax=Salinigranum marinum TaxID=1515595 RepID=UPI002989DDDE|nr:hypothetical protein [Salinigranum marinum]